MAFVPVKVHTVKINTAADLYFPIYDGSALKAGIAHGDVTVYATDPSGNQAEIPSGATSFYEIGNGIYRLVCTAIVFDELGEWTLPVAVNGAKDTAIHVLCVETSESTEEMYQCTRGSSYQLRVVLFNGDDLATGIAHGDVVAYATDPSGNQAEITTDASTWTEIGNGVYELEFTPDEDGEWTIAVMPTGADDCVRRVVCIEPASITAITDNDFLILAGGPISDTAGTISFSDYHIGTGLTANDEDADFPVENAQDARLNVKACSQHKPDANETITMTMTLGSTSYDPAFILLAGHNFGDFAAVDWTLEITYPIVGVVQWDVTDLMQEKTVVIDMRVVAPATNIVDTISFVGTYTGGGVYPTGNPTHLAIGRFAVFGADDYIQPESDNIQRDWNLEPLPQGSVTKTPSARYAVNPGMIRSASGSFEAVTEDDRDALLGFFAEFGTHTPILAILYPSRIVWTGDFDGDGELVNTYAGKQHAYYAWIDRLGPFAHRANDLSSGAIELTEVWDDA